MTDDDDDNVDDDDDDVDDDDDSDGNCQHFPFFCFLSSHLISQQGFFYFLHKISDQIFQWLFRGSSRQLQWPGGGECHCR